MSALGHWQTFLDVRFSLDVALPIFAEIKQTLREAIASSVMRVHLFAVADAAPRPPPSWGACCWWSSSFACFRS
jgi:hypothetical protein